MKEPFVMKRKDGSQKVSVDGLKTFIKEVYIKDYNDVINNSLYLKEHVDSLEKVARIISRAHNNTDAKCNLAILGVIGLGFLAKKRFMTHTKQIESLREDNSELHNKVDQLEAELFEMNERLHALAEKEDKKEG